MCAANRRVLLGTLLVLLCGCMHARRAAPVAPNEVAEKIQFPSNWHDEGTTATIEGPQLRALQIAMEDFRPPGQKPPKRADPIEQCIARLDTYDVWIKKGEKMTFIYFNPRETERCGLQPITADVSATYAISDDGVILKRE